MCNFCIEAGLNADEMHASAKLAYRRSFLRFGAVAAASPWALGSAWSAGPSDGRTAAPNAIKTSEALARLMEGNARYVANKPTTKDYMAGRAERTKVQYPIAAVLSCADSRLAPEFAFDQGVGELFVARVAGNYASPAVLSSLEYAVAVLGVPLIVVLGHTNCGAVSATAKSIDTKDMLPGTLQDIVSAIQPAVVRAQSGTGGSLLDRAIVENVKLQLQALATRPSLVKSMLDEKKINIVGAVYDLSNGKVTLV